MERHIIDYHLKPTDPETLLGGTNYGGGEQIEIDSEGRITLTYPTTDGETDHAPAIKNKNIDIPSRN